MSSKLSELWQYIHTKPTKREDDCFMGIKIITICGSMRFSEQMKRIAWNLESDKGYSVIQCVYNENSEPIDDRMVKNMAEAHYKKIDICDLVYIVDTDNYVGTSVKKEIEYAKLNGKEIVFHSKEVLPAQC